MNSEPDIATPFHCAPARVLPAWIDFNGHMNVGYYHVAFDLSADSFFDWLGLTTDYRRAHDASTFALESHLHFVREVREGDPLRFEARLLDVDYKRIHYYIEMFHGTEGYLAATYESVSAHMSMRSRRTAPIAPELAQRLAVVLRAHQALPRPWQVGHVISARPNVPR